MLVEETKIQWQEVCKIQDLIPHAGVSVLLNDQTQVALFYQPETKLVFAINNWDPIGRANVLYRGLMGGVDGEPTVASPLYKHRFSLKHGYCLDDPDADIEVYKTCIKGQSVQLRTK